MCGGGAALKDIGYDKMTVLEIIADALHPATDPDADIVASHAILAESRLEAAAGAQLQPAFDGQHDPGDRRRRSEARK